MQLYYGVQATVSVIRNSEVVRYSGVSIVLYQFICMETAVGACNSVHYSVDVRYWECPLVESPLYTSICGMCDIHGVRGMEEVHT